MSGFPRTLSVLAAEAYLLLFPVGHLLVVPVGGALATGADVVLLGLVLAWGWEVLNGRSAGAGARPPGRVVHGLLLLVGFGAWVGASSLWGYHPAYALAKGTGMAALGLGALALATSGIGWRRAADAWLSGTALALALTLALGVTGPEALRARVVAGGSGVLGLPFPRLSGPFLHPNMFGDYLVASGLVLWGRWAEWSETSKGVAWGLAAAIGGALALTASTAWVGAGIGAILVGRRLAREGHAAWGGALRVGGLLAAAGTFILLVLPLDVEVIGNRFVTGAIRPAIWAASLTPFLQDPLLGVGAAPYLAEAADRLHGGAVGLWDAHNAYLSVLGQFGVVGAALAGFGAWWACSGVRPTPQPPGDRAGWSRARLAVAFALVAVAVDALFLASEDLRHVWVLIGVAGSMGASRAGYVGGPRAPDAT